MRIALLALAGTVFMGNAVAATSPVTGSFNVTATVVESCVVMSDDDIDFGDYDPVDVNRTTAALATGAITLRCSQGTVIDVALDEGANAAVAGCDAPARRMEETSATTAHLAYEIFLDSTRTNAWGCNATAQQDITATSSTSDITLVTYGRIPAGQDVPVGDYQDTVTYTVTF